MKRKNKSIGKSILMGMAFIAILALVSAIVMLLWNAIIPSVIGWSTVTYWQSVGILILSRILFGKFGRPGKHHHKCCKKGDKYGHIHEKMHNMSPEERREYIRSQMSRHKKYWCNDTECEDLEDATDIRK